MLVEDNEVNMEVSKSILLREGCEVTTAIDGIRAVAEFENGQFDVIFMDCHMPEMDGFEATTAIRAREAGSRRHTPIVALTANAIAGDREYCLRAGMDDYISKPVSRLAIQVMLERWCRETNSTDTKRRGKSGRLRAVQEGVELSDKALAMLRELEDDENQGIVQRIMSMFLDATPGQLEVLRQAGEDGDANTIRITTHTLKSAAASVGAMSLSDCCAELEDLAREGCVDGALVLIEAIVREYKIIKPSIEAHARDATEYAAE
jgi:CheY-like chemotaxis protein/HPt (histidine-containing phosphotransfer) domain-containing protein